MAALTVQTISLTGLTPTTTAAGAGGDTFANAADASTFLRVENGGGGSVTVTIASTTTCSQGGTHDVAVAVAAGAKADIGPFDPTRFGTTVSVTYSGVSSVTVAARRLPRP